MSNSKLPEPSRAVEILSRATCLYELWSDGDASDMLSSGFELVGVCPTPESEHPFMYTLIWPLPTDQMPNRFRERVGV